MTKLQRFFEITNTIQQNHLNFLRIIHFHLLFFAVICTFAAVNTKMKRHIASWILLAVFLPMLILSSVHIHHNAPASEELCSHCVQHHCNGHLGQLTTSTHSCVICQFLTLSFVAAVATAAVFYKPTYHLPSVHRHHAVCYGVCGVISLRAPPSV